VRREEQQLVLRHQPNHVDCTLERNVIHRIRRRLEALRDEAAQEELFRLGGRRDGNREAMLNERSRRWLRALSENRFCVETSRLNRIRQLAAHRPENASRAIFLEPNRLRIAAALGLDSSRPPETRKHRSGLAERRPQHELHHLALSPRHRRRRHADRLRRRTPRKAWLLRHEGVRVAIPCASAQTAFEFAD
jgi:hypothetical protein